MPYAGLRGIYDFYVFDINMKDQHPHELSFCFAVPMTNLLYSFKKTVVAADVVSPEKTSCQ